MTEKRRRGRPKKEPAVTSYRLSDEELVRYRQLPPDRDFRMRITAERTRTAGASRR